MREGSHTMSLVGVWIQVWHSQNLCHFCMLFKIVFILFFLFCCFVWVRVCVALADLELCRPDWHWTHKNPPASFNPNAGIKGLTTTCSSRCALGRHTGGLCTGQACQGVRADGNAHGLRWFPLCYVVLDHVQPRPACWCPQSLCCPVWARFHWVYQGECT